MAVHLPLLANFVYICMYICIITVHFLPGGGVVLRDSIIRIGFYQFWKWQRYQFWYTLHIFDQDWIFGIIVLLEYFIGLFVMSGEVIMILACSVSFSEHIQLRPFLTVLQLPILVRI